MEIGRINKLTASRPIEFGFILIDEEENEVLLPNAYLSEDIKLGEELEVFVYYDSEDRVVATTITPKVQLEEFAFLQVKEVNQYGAFLDWGLPKDLMVPFAEQARPMEAGNSYLIFMLYDEMSDRLYATSKIKDYLFFDEIDVKQGDEVDLLLYEFTELGMNTIVNNMYKGLIFKSNIHKKIECGDIIKGYVQKVREDGKLDILLEPLGYKNTIQKTSKLLIDNLKENDGFLSLTDKSSPEEIKNILGISKKAFKKSVGYLYKQKIITLESSGVRLKE